MAAIAETESARPELNRIPALDVLRGAALVAMFAYHLMWDLAYFGLAASDLPRLPASRLFSHAIASVFLMLVGAGLVLAARNGLRWRPYLRRLGLIVAACAAITAGTWFAFPDAFIFFGILHCIALSSIVALPFLRAPWWLTLVIAGAVLMLPFRAATTALDGPMWLWLGLGTIEPRTNDWRPFIPWFGMVLTGVALMRLAIGLRWDRALARLPAGGLPGRVLSFGGRHSLAVYLLHQPVFIVFVMGVAWAAGTWPQTDETRFVRACTAQCTAQGREAPFCARVCGCVMTRARVLPYWQNVLHNTLSAAQNESFGNVARQCVRDDPASLSGSPVTQP